MGKKGGVNEKRQKGMELKAANKAAKDAVSAAKREAVEAAEWSQGANNRGAARAAAANAKADEAARKRAEKAALVAAEEADMASSGKPKKLPTTKSKKGKKKNDVSLLESTLLGDAEKKSKEKKRATRLKQEREERLKLERERKKAEDAKKMDPLLANTNSMIGSSLERAQGGTLNASLKEGEVAASGLDSALSALSVSKTDAHPEKRMKALHKAFEEKMMPEMKEQYPGLKRSQYLEKIFLLWKKSPENPMNWPKSD